MSAKFSCFLSLKLQQWTMLNRYNCKMHKTWLTDLQSSSDWLATPCVGCCSKLGLRILLLMGINAGPPSCLHVLPCSWFFSLAPQASAAGPQHSIHPDLSIKLHWSDILITESKLSKESASLEAIKGDTRSQVYTPLTPRMSVKMAFLFIFCKITGITAGKGGNVSNPWGRWGRN